MKKIIAYSIFAVVALSACTNKDDDQINRDYVNVSVYLQLFDKSGVNLLNPNNPNSYTRDDIQVYFNVDGRWEQQAETNPYTLYTAKPFTIENREDSSYINIWAYANKNEPFSYTLVKWHSSDVGDTLKCQFEYFGFNHTESYSVAIQNVWLNEKLVWGKGMKNSDGSYARYVTLVK